MYRVRLICSQCGSYIQNVISYNENNMVVNCSKCGNVTIDFRPDQTYTPQEFKRKLTSENYWKFEQG